MYACLKLIIYYIVLIPDNIYFLFNRKWALMCYLIQRFSVKLIYYFIKNIGNIIGTNLIIQSEYWTVARKTLHVTRRMKHEVHRKSLTQTWIPSCTLHNPTKHAHVAHDTRTRNTLSTLKWKFYTFQVYRPLNIILGQHNCGWGRIVSGSVTVMLSYMN